MEGLGHIAVRCTCFSRGQAVQSRWATAMHVTVRICVLPNATVIGITIQRRPSVLSATELNQVLRDENLDPLARRVANDRCALHEPSAN